MGGLFVQVEPLSSLGIRITLSNIPPFMADNVVLPFLERLGVLRLSIRPVSQGYREPALRHILSFKRQVSIELRNDTECEGSFVIPFEEKSYKIFYMTNTYKTCCFVCKAKDHMRADCPTVLKEVSTPQYPDKPKEKTSVIPEASVLSSHPGPSSAEDQWQTVRVWKGEESTEEKIRTRRQREC